MAELLAIPASAIALAQAIQLTCGSLTRIYGAKDAPVAAQRIADELGQTLAIVNEIERYAKDINTAPPKEAELLIHSQLLAFKTCLHDYLAFLSPHLSQSTQWARLKLRAKWVVAGLNKKLDEVLNRVSDHRGRLQLAFSLYSSYESRCSSQQVQRQLEDLSRTIAAKYPSATSPKVVTTFRGGSLQACGELLSDVAPILRQLLMDSNAQTQLGHRGGWVLSQLHAVLTEVFDGCLTCTKSVAGPAQGVQTIRYSTSYDDRQGIGAAMQVTKKSMSSISLRIGTPIAPVLSIEAAERGLCVHFMLAYSQPSNPGGDLDPSIRYRLYVDSGSAAGGSGSVVHVLQDDGGRPQLWRGLSGFGTHPREAPVFRSIKDGDLRALRGMLSLRVVAPNDRDEDGNSLLWHAVWGTTDVNIDVCQLLLQEGADPADTNRKGDHALAVMVMQLAFPDRSIHRPFEMMKLLLGYAPDSDIYGTLRYKSRRGVDEVPAGLLHCAVPRRRGQCEARVPMLYTWLIQEGGLDLEQPDRNGNTPLLCAVFYLPRLRISSLLLDAGADVRATNKYGENALHLLCRRLSACSKPDLADTDKEAVICLLARLISEGLAPLIGNIVGFTPIDAAMSPRVWPLLCSALKRNGRTMRQELQLLDLASGITISEAEVNAKFAAVMSQRRLSTAKDCLPKPSKAGSLHNPEDKVCYLCNRSTEIFFRDAPFDEFTSEIVDELGHGLHGMYYNHPCDDVCYYIHKEDSCYALDYHPAEMSKGRLMERSWRRHVAALLEERGLLQLY
ncbi:ankyrin repeat-containing domain protein [Immersiella caudata]|uniref:Ankyrin repeat-containing domain protein n=1 Tax=Immersiella caudata TaxID=314043 RepID=A0AA39W473_9PEZI|nr:ankyrin repeat-containing domain protein [Immersiella caudata]